MKTLFFSLFSFLLVFSLNAQVTTFGAGAGTLGSGASYYGYKAGANTLATTRANTFVGHASGTANEDGYNNTFLGANSGVNNIKGYSNTFIGVNAGFKSTSGINNTTVGVNAGYFLSGGKHNTYVGVRSGKSNLNGIGNTTMGFSAGEFQEDSNYNTFIGYQTGTNLLTGGNNTFYGKRAGFSKTSGTNNVFIGANSGQGNLTGSGNVFLGYWAGASETGHNKLYIANSGTPIPLIYGDFKEEQLGVKTNVIPPGYTMAVNGKVIAEEVRVQLAVNWPDYVFEPTYDLMSIEDLKKYISENKHLPEVPSAAELEEEGGVDVGEMNQLLLKKVEELSLYIIQLKEEVEALKQK